MKNTYVNNIPVAHGELSIVMSDNAEKVMKHSSALAKKIKDAGVGVLLINCGMSNKRFREHAGYPEEGNPKVHYLIHTSYRGDLIGERDGIEQLVRECGIRVIIIAGWEWTSNSYRRKEKLIYFLRELMAEKDVAVIVYSQAPTKPVIGKYDRGGVGKLAMLAISIINDETAEVLEKAEPKPPPLVYNGKEELEAMERSAQLLASKINDLQGKNGAVLSPQSFVISKEERKNGRIEKNLRMKDKKPM